MSTTRRSFLKMIAGALVAGPVVVKAALAKQPVGESCYGGTFAEVALRDMRLSEPRLWVGHGKEVIRLSAPLSTDFTEQFGRDWNETMIRRTLGLEKTYKVNFTPAARKALGLE